MSSESKSRVLYENLDTSFVNLWALLRHLSQRAFVGRVHVEMDDYSADVFLTGSNTPLVHEVDRAAGTEVLEEAAMHRLVLRARESPGSISVFEGAEEAVAVRGVEPAAKTEPVESTAAADELSVTPPSAAPLIDESQSSGGVASSEAPVATEPEEMVEWHDVVKVSGELIGGVERALNFANSDFTSLFRAARLELADDYTFLDPTSGSLEYSNSVAAMREELPVSSYVAGLSEALRRVVDKVATGDRARRVRERVALDLALVARKRREVLKRSGFQEQLDRIAGTKVI
ncbi:MAG TPA: hypothetical protein VHE60_13700 [Pyrinomonadaceae bacterium]|nr:hypothetical protein [Pyrinomonadaceae bacterium]